MNRPFRENLFEIRYLYIHINICIHNAFVIVNSGNPKSSFPGFVKPRGLSRAMCLQVERRKGDSRLCQRIIRQVFKLKSMPFIQKFLVELDANHESFFSHRLVKFTFNSWSLFILVAPNISGINLVFVNN